jgi:hypothetical protein
MKTPPQMAPDSKGPDGVYDPSANVLALVEAAVQRINDLSVLEAKRQDELRAADIRRADDLRAAESRRVDEQAELRAEFADKLTNAEAKRIDANRAGDVSAMSVSNERSAAQATLAAVAQQQVTAALTSRITALELVQSEGAGKQAVSDPALAQLVEQVRVLAQAAAANAGAGQGGKDLKVDLRSNMQLALTIFAGLVAGGGIIAAIVSRLPHP